jgi:hypothetical protein
MARHPLSESGRPVQLRLVADSVLSQSKRYKLYPIPVRLSRPHVLCLAPALLHGTDDNRELGGLNMNGPCYVRNYAARNKPVSDSIGVAVFPQARKTLTESELWI